MYEAMTNSFPNTESQGSAHPAKDAPLTGRLIEPDWSHLTQMVSLHRVTQTFHHKHYPSLFPVPDPDDNHRSYFGNYLPLPSPLARVLKLKNPLRKRTGFALGWEIQGVLYAYLLYKIEKPSGFTNSPGHWTIRINDIGVSSDYRKSGIASNLINALFERTASLKPCNYFANVYDQNIASAALFEKQGFRTISAQYHFQNEGSAADKV